MQKDDNLLIELLDEQDNPVLFEHISTVLYQNKEYIVLMPLDEEAEEDTVVILEIVPGNDEDEYIAVEDEAILLAVYDLYVEQAEDND